MKAICLDCYTVIEFRNQRGARLKDHKCKCGGSFSRMQYDYDQGTGEPFYRVQANGMVYRFRQFQGVWINTDIMSPAENKGEGG